LILSKGQIERIWNSFDVGKNNDGVLESLDMSEFLNKYPNINPSLKESLSREENVSSNGESQKNDIATNDETKSLESQHSIVIKEEEKLQRMLTKIQSQSSIASSIRSEIETLFTQELEAVIELWINVANNSINKIDNDEGSLFALERASSLLLQYEAEYVKGLRQSLDEDDDNAHFFPAVPHTISYQNIISAYQYILNKRERDISQSNLVRMQSQCSVLLKKMMKHILSQRTESLEESSSSVDEGHTNARAFEPRGKLALSTSYKHLISMYTSRLHLSSYTHGFQMATMARDLLQEMELYYHDFFTVPLPSKKNQEFLLSIHPTARIFNSVILSYTRISIKFQCPVSAKRALEIVTRMGKRYEAYMREAVELKDTKGAMLPNLTSYKAVLSAFASLDDVTIDTLEDINAMVNTMEKHGNVQFDTTMANLLKECWSKCSHPQKEHRIRDMHKKICRPEEE